MEVSNRYFGYLYNKLNFLVRFVYCRVPFLNRILFWKLYTSDFRALDTEFEEMKEMLSRRGFDFKNKVCLEIGPGNSYINAYNLLMHGAKKVIMVDKFPRYIRTSKQRDYFKRELQYIKRKQGKNELIFWNGEELDKRYIQFIPKELTQIELQQEVDFVLSISVFEHIKDVAGNIRKLSRVVKPGGIMFHKIDMRDHYNFNKPFLFYTYSEETWNSVLTKEGVSYTNRLRYGDFKELFEASGFRILDQKLCKFPLNAQKIHSQIARKSDLDVGIAAIVLQK